MTTRSPDKPDLEEFRDLTRTKAPLEVRAAAIRQQFPSVHRLDWHKLFDVDIEICGRIVRDIMKLDQAEPGRPGPRRALELDEGMRRLVQFQGEDYTLEPFQGALRSLAGGRSVRHLARKVGLDRNHVYRLLRGELPPDFYAMDSVARAFDKHPSFFLEYRLAFIMACLSARMEQYPDMSIALYRRVATALDEAS